MSSPQMTLFGLSSQVPSREIDSNKLITQTVSWKPESIRLMTQGGFQELTQNEFTTHVDFPGMIQIHS